MCVCVCVIQCRNCGETQVLHRECVCVCGGGGGGGIYPDKIFVSSQDKGNQGQWTTQELNRLSTN